MSSSTSTTKQILNDLSPFAKIYTDGTVERLAGESYVPPTPYHPSTGVSSKDNTTPPCRIYLPKMTTTTTNKKLPILVYYHGGGFILETAFSAFDRNYMTPLCAESNAIIISVEYRLIPEHPLPAAYEDSWTALKWVCSHFETNPLQPNMKKDPWITNHGDFNKIFVYGESAGANIAHNMAMRAGSESLPGGLRILGAIIAHPYFFGSTPFGKERRETLEEHLLYRIWMSGYPNCVGGIDSPMINPIANGAPCLSGIGCNKVLVCMSEKDPFTKRALAYVERLKKSGWPGVVEVVMVQGEDHCFQLFSPECEKAKDLIKSIASFLQSN